MNDHTLVTLAVGPPSVFRVEGNFRGSYCRVCILLEDFFKPLDVCGFAVDLSIFIKEV